MMSELAGLEDMIQIDNSPYHGLRNVTFWARGLSNTSERSCTISSGQARRNHNFPGEWAAYGLPRGSCLALELN